MIGIYPVDWYFFDKYLLFGYILPRKYTHVLLSAKPSLATDDEYRRLQIDFLDKADLHRISTEVEIYDTGRAVLDRKYDEIYNPRIHSMDTI